MQTDFESEQRFGSYQPLKFQAAAHLHIAAGTLAKQSCWMTIGTARCDLVEAEPIGIELA